MFDQIWECDVIMGGQNLKNIKKLTLSLEYTTGNDNSLLSIFDKITGLGGGWGNMRGGAPPAVT